MPPFQKKKKYRTGFKKWADEKALSIRSEMGLKPSSPLCAFKLCEHLNIPLFVPSEVKGLSSEYLSQLLVLGSSHWSAVTVPVGENCFIIHNNTHSKERQQSNLMHELAHIICKHKVPNETLIMGLSGFLRNYNEEHENEAEWLGGCLQLPRPAVLYSLRNNMSNEDIATHYNCSVEMATYRINITGAKKQLSYIKW